MNSLSPEETGKYKILGRSCATCKFSILYVNGKNETAYYECRFSPPQLYCYPSSQSTPSLFNQVTIYPRLGDFDWCYQYVKKQEAKCYHRKKLKR